MKIERIQISVAELCQGYEERGTDGIEGIVAYGGLLDVRPPYQREYVYDPKERDEVIRTVRKGFPLNAESMITLSKPLLLRFSMAGANAPTPGRMTPEADSITVGSLVMTDS